MTNSNTFLPTFGNKPKHIIGRSGITADFLEGLSLPIGHRQRATMLIGQRGTGKTTLLLEFADLAQQAGFVPARVTANDEMLDEIIQLIQINGSHFVPAEKPKIKGVSAGAMGFSLGLTFTEEAKTQFGPRIKLSLLCDELAKHNKGILILVDEVQPNAPAIRTLATTYQHLVGENKNIALVMAGLPTSMSAVLNDDILTFLNRAYKVYLEPLPLGEISVAYATEFEKQGKTIASEVLEEAALATKGYPYLYQLIGYYILGFAQNADTITEEIVRRAISTSKREMIESIFAAALKPLSARDKEFLEAMSKDQDASKISDISERMGVSRTYAQSYRLRLIESGVIAPVARGELSFEIPYLGEYLRGEF
ncbi:MAG: ATP-binding protein [Coriobacteriia bacterium]|nr:ATP-binding protein [Coriobacteriia bacterium]